MNGGYQQLQCRLFDADQQENRFRFPGQMPQCGDFGGITVMQSRRGTGPRVAESLPVHFREGLLGEWNNSEHDYDETPAEPLPGGPASIDQNVGSGDKACRFGTEVTG